MRGSAAIEVTCDGCEKTKITIIFTEANRNWDDPQFEDKLRAAGWALPWDDPMCQLHLCPECWKED